ncbi:MAG: alpha/beta hydrolase [Hyphomicrobiales bacterium]|nr:alpha/beta hydrolase [Hyphomicrobiales bacterium]
MNDVVVRPIETVAQARALEAQAQLFETPCGDGRMIWRAWGAGDESRAPVVLLHGGSGSWAHWARNIAPLVARGRKVFAPDLPGCGDSDRPPFGEDGDVLPPWIEVGAAALGLAQFDLVGFSFGAMVSGFYAADYPHRVKKLVLVGPPALSDKPSPKIGLKEWLRLPDGPQREEAFRHNLRLLMLARDESVDDLSITLYVEALKKDRLTKRRIAGTDVLLRTMPRIGAPVWGVWGEDDILYRGRLATGEAGLAHAPDFRGVTNLPGAGHWAQFEAANAFNVLLAGVLSA